MDMNGFMVICLKHETETEQNKYRGHNHLLYCYITNVGNYLITCKYIKVKNMHPADATPLFCREADLL